MLQEVAKAQMGDFMEIEWLDAASIRGARIKKPPLPNAYVETRRRTYGVFICLQKGETWCVPALTLLMDQTDDSSVIITIPTPVIMHVKLRPRTFEAGNEAELAHKISRRFVRHEKSRVAYKDGAVKLLSRSWKPFIAQ